MSEQTHVYEFSAVVLTAEPVERHGPHEPRYLEPSGGVTAYFRDPDDTGDPNVLACVEWKASGRRFLAPASSVLYLVDATPDD